MNASNTLDSASVVPLPAEITLATAQSVAKLLVQQIRALPPGPVGLDAKALDRFDSSFWSLWATLKRDTGRSVLLNNLPPQLIALGQVYGVWGVEAERQT